MWSPRRARHVRIVRCSGPRDTYMDMRSPDSTPAPPSTPTPALQIRHTEAHPHIGSLGHCSFSQGRVLRLSSRQGLGGDEVLRSWQTEVTRTGSVFPLAKATSARPRCSLAGMCNCCPERFGGIIQTACALCCIAGTVTFQFHLPAWRARSKSIVPTWWVGYSTANLLILSTTFALPPS